ncbi:MAG: ribosome silencing factor [Kiritimatiellaeota bacterium]|nr:ribosome silencing factor [Kiritimatiellota bacterium]
MKALDIAKLAAKAIDDKKGEDIRIVDIRKVSPIADYVVIASADTSPHLKALEAEVSKQLREKAKQTSKRESGSPESAWIVMDYFDVIVHLFTPEARAYYDIETLWAKGKSVPLADTAQDPL